jgi:hypothetical protein
MMANITQPSLFIPHGGGPCFFMPDPNHTWTGMERFLKGLVDTLPERPKAIIVVSGHWETRGFAFTGAGHPGLIYDYGGFPADTYQLRYDVPGAPALAGRTAQMLRDAGLSATVDPTRGLDHGVFVPLKVAFPDADIPLIEMSVEKDELPQHARLRRPTLDGTLAGVRSVAHPGNREARRGACRSAEIVGPGAGRSLLTSGRRAPAATHGCGRRLPSRRQACLHRTGNEDSNLRLPLRLTVKLTERQDFMVPTKLHSALPGFVTIGARFGLAVVAPTAKPAPKRHD